MSDTRSTDQLIMIMLADQQRLLARRLLEQAMFAEIDITNDDHHETIIAEFRPSVRNVRVTTSIMNMQRAMTVDHECTHDLDSVHIRKINTAA